MIERPRRKAQEHKSTRGSEWATGSIPISKDEGMGVAPHERPELHDADEAIEVQHFGARILPVRHAREVEQLGSLRAMRRVSTTAYAWRAAHSDT